MKIIRWLLSHTFLILLIVIVIYGYMFWGNLLGKDTPAGKAVAYISDEFVVVKDFVEAVKEKQARLNAGESPDPQPAAQTAEKETKSLDEEETLARSSAASENLPSNQVIVNTPSPTDTIVIERNTAPIEQQFSDHLQKQPDINDIEQVQRKDDSVEIVQSGNMVEQSNASELSGDNTGNIVQAEVVVKNKEAETEKAEVTEMEESSADDTVIAKTSAGNEARQVKADQQSNVASSEKATVNNSFVSAEIEQRLDNVDTQGRVINQLYNDDAVRADWVAARKSFYQRNYELSEQSYQKIIKNTDDNFDAYGELGNVYFNQGKNKQAASAYYEAAAILVNKGQVSRAKSLMGLLRHLDKSKADGLQQLIDSKKS